MTELVSRRLYFLLLRLRLRDDGNPGGAGALRYHNRSPDQPPGCEGAIAGLIGRMRPRRAAEVFSERGEEGLTYVEGGRRALNGWPSPGVAGF